MDRTLANPKGAPATGGLLSLAVAALIVACSSEPAPDPSRPLRRRYLSHRRVPPHAGVQPGLDDPSDCLTLQCGPSGYSFEVSED